MKWMNVRSIYGKELLGAVRDRRTLISMIIIPLIFYPLLFFGIGYFSVLGQKKSASLPSDVLVNGGEILPPFVEMLSQDENLKLFSVKEADKETFIRDGGIYLQIERQEDAEDENRLKNHHIVILYDSTVQRSQVARKRLSASIENYQEQVIRERLAGLGLTSDLIHPIQEEWQDVAPEERKIGSMLGMILPYIVIILIFIGAMNSAIDITAGEKERGTLATLLVSQLSRLEIVIGKYLTVMTVSATSMLLGLIGLSIAFLTPAYALGELSFIKANFSFSLFFLFFLVLAPLVGLASAILLLTGIFARNSREASSYVTPIYMAAIFLGMISLSQGMELSEPMFLIPILNNSFALKELLAGNVHWGHIFSTIASNTVIAAIALLAAARLFTREGVLFRS